MPHRPAWSNPYGLGEMAASGHREFDNARFFAEATPFTTSLDFSVYDHIKYLAISNQAFAVPERGSVTFSLDIEAETPGTIDGYVVEGTYGPPMSYPGGEPYAATALQGQQAGATLHMIDFATGQLFDWFVSWDKAFTLIERLPSNVTNPLLPVSDPAYVGREKMYTQIIEEVDIEPGVPHTVSIKYTRDKNQAWVEYFLDGKRVSKVDRVGVPLDVQHQRYTILARLVRAPESRMREGIFGPQRSGMCAVSPRARRPALSP